MSQLATGQGPIQNPELKKACFSEIPGPSVASNCSEDTRSRMCLVSFNVGYLPSGNLT